MHDIALGLSCLCLVAGAVLLFRDIRMFLISRPPSVFGALLFGLPLAAVYVFSQADDLNTLPAYSRTIDYWQSAITFLPLTFATALCGYRLGGKPVRSGWFRYLGKSAVCGVVLAILEGLIVSPGHGFAQYLLLVAVGSIGLVPYCILLAVALRLFANATAAARAASSASVDTTIGRVESRHVAFAFICRFFVPLLVCAPVALIVRYDVSIRKHANDILLQHAEKIDAQMGDLKDLNDVRAGVLAHKQIVDALEDSALHAASALHIVGDLPDGVKLSRMETKQQHLSLTVRCGALSDELALLSWLAQTGYRDLRISTRESEQVGTIEMITLEANASRGESP